MRLHIYIAKRYLFAKKSRNAINIISAVSVAGVAVGTMALVIILSVFNGLESMVSSIFNTFDPDIRITAEKGKSFIPGSERLQKLAAINGVECYSLVIEENALLKYGDREYIATIKGVDSAYVIVSGIDSTMWEGEFALKGPNGREYAVPGVGVAQYLGIRINFITPLNVIVPRKDGGSALSPENSLRSLYIFPSGIYEIEKEYDSKYVYVPLGFARQLTEMDEGVTSVEVKFSSTAEPELTRDKIESVFASSLH